MSRVSLRTATPADLALLEHWDSNPHVAAAGGNDDRFDWQYELPRDLAWRELLIAEYADEPIGCIQIIDPRLEETHYWGDIEPNLRAMDIWIGEANNLGRGYGTHMMTLALDRCFESPEVTAVILDPLAGNTRAIRFYERLGFKVLYERRFGNDDCVVCRLSREAWSLSQRHAASRSRTSA